MAQNANEILKQLDSLLSRDNYSAAKEHLLTHLATAQKDGNNNIILLLFNELMGLCRKLGLKDEAVGYTEKALLKIKEMGIEQNIGAATTYLNCATVYKAFGRAADAIPLFEKAEEIYNKNLSPNDTRFGGLYNNMGLALVDLKQFTRAADYYNKAISVMKQNKGKEPEQAITYLNLASAVEAELGLLAAEGKIGEYLSVAEQLLDSGKNRTDGEYAFVCDKCSSVFGYYGYFAYENELINRKRRIYERA
ncbi:MAG: tetratricopeptide repeat protein [Clostridia bacterium]|nr:tetratricopeptide repeat protein [Clostridia bacterium]